jgi:serine protease AprX
LAASLLVTLAATANAQSAPPAVTRGCRRTCRSSVKTNGDFQPTTVIITASQAKVDRLAAKQGLRVQQRLAAGAVLEIPAYRLATWPTTSEVDSLSSNHEVAGQMAITNQTIGADQVQAGLAGLPGLNGRGITVAVIDSGVANVPELSGRILASVDFTDAHGQGLDKFGHGTHVAGIIAAAGQNSKDDTRGVAPGANIVSLKVLDGDGKGRAANVIAALDWVVEHAAQYNIRIANLSLGGPVLQSYKDDPIDQAVERAYRAGIIVVASAGNYGKDVKGPVAIRFRDRSGQLPFAITVGALNTQGDAYRSDDVLATTARRARRCSTG